jgi:aminodeoxyfutalosine synthase
VVVALEEVAGKVEAGQALSDADIDALEGARDIIALGTLGESIRRKLHGTEATFVRVFDVKPDEKGFREPFSTDALKKAPGTFSPGEIRIFDTPHTLDAAVSVITSALEFAGSTPLSAFCLFELSKLGEGLPVVLRALKEAGLEFITQAPIDRLASPERALEAVTDAGLQLARLTINETPARTWTSLCREVAALQRQLRSLRAFAPLARKIDVTQPTTGYGDVKRVAIARILIQEIPTIQVDWALYGPKLAQVALAFGADDLDSVSAIDDASQGHRRSPLEEIRRSIEAASLGPVERDARFTPR